VAVANVDEESSVGQALRAVGGIATELFETVVGPPVDKPAETRATLQMSAAVAERAAVDKGAAVLETGVGAESVARLDLLLDRPKAGDIFAEEEAEEAWQLEAARRSGRGAAAAAAATEEAVAEEAAAAAAFKEEVQGLGSLVAAEAAKWSEAAAGTRAAGAVEEAVEAAAAAGMEPVRAAIAAVEASCEDLLVRQSEASEAEAEAAEAAKAAAVAATTLAEAELEAEAAQVAAAAAAEMSAARTSALVRARAAECAAEASLAASQGAVDGLSDVRAVETVGLEGVREALVGIEAGVEVRDAASLAVASRPLRPLYVPLIALFAPRDPPAHPLRCTLCRSCSSGALRPQHSAPRPRPQQQKRPPRRQRWRAQRARASPRVPRQRWRQRAARRVRGGGTRRA
jgi:hypothetical protein